jgi:hypothetical protein
VGCVDNGGVKMIFGGERIWKSERGRDKKIQEGYFEEIDQPT